MKAVPDPRAIRIEIKSEKFVEKKIVKNTPKKSQNRQFFLQFFFHIVYSLNL